MWVEILFVLKFLFLISCCHLFHTLFLTSIFYPHAYGCAYVTKRKYFYRHLYILSKMMMKAISRRRSLRCDLRANWIVFHVTFQHGRYFSPLTFEWHHVFTQRYAYIFDSSWCCRNTELFFSLHSKRVKIVRWNFDVMRRPGMHRLGQRGVSCGCVLWLLMSLATDKKLRNAQEMVLGANKNLLIIHKKQCLLHK